MPRLSSKPRSSGSGGLSAAHPVRWAASAATAVALLGALGYYHLRTPYTRQEIQDWPERARNVYLLWRSDMGSPTRTAVLVFLLLLTTYCFRRYRQAELVRRPGPIEVVNLDNATTDKNVNVAELSTRLRNNLARVDLYSPTSVPGAGRSEDFLELLKSVGSQKTPLGTLAGLLGITWVTHAYRVNGILRQREGPEPYGVTVHVATLPRGGASPKTIWATSWDEAIDKAAIAVGAAVLPLTRLCRKPPWHDWQRQEMDYNLFADYLEAKSLTQEQRFDEALGKYYDALRLDPLNLYLRLEAGALQEQLQLFLDALQTYDDIIALGSRRDERWRRSALYTLNSLTIPFRSEGRKKKAEDERPPLYIADEGWRSRRARSGLRPAVSCFRGTDRQRALLLARYRYALVLGFSEVFLAQWLRHADKGALGTTRDLERDRLRARLLPRLSRYAYIPSDSLQRLAPDAAQDHVTRTYYIIGASRADTHARLSKLEKELRSSIRSVRQRAPELLNQPELSDLEARLHYALKIADDEQPMSAPVLHRGAECLLAATAAAPHGAWKRERAAAWRVAEQLRFQPFEDLPRETSPIEIARVQATQEALTHVASVVAKHVDSCDEATRLSPDGRARLEPAAARDAEHSPAAAAELLQDVAVAVLTVTAACPHKSWSREREIAARALPRAGGRVLAAVTPSRDLAPVEVARQEQLENDLRRAIRSTQRKATRSPDCTVAHEHFASQIKDATDFAADWKRPSDQDLRRASKSLIAATSLCDAKDWRDECAIAHEVVGSVAPLRRHVPTTIQVLSAQELLQQAARSEMRRLVHDYRWWTGRRRRGISVTQAALRVSLVWSELRLARIRWLIEQELDAFQWPDEQANEPDPRWPPDVGSVRRDISRALRTRPWRLHQWQDYYNAACAYAIPLLSANSWAGQSTDRQLAVTRARPDLASLPDSELTSAQYTLGAVRALERAIDRSDSSFVASRRNWLAVGDPDLVGLRTRPEYARFQARNFPSMTTAPVLPKTVHALQLSAYVTELTKAMATAMIARWKIHLDAGRTRLHRDDVRAWLESDREAWRRVLSLAREHRDWRARHDALLFLRSVSTLVRSQVSVPYPVYPDERIGDMRGVSAAGDLRAITAASTNARQERATQVERLAVLIADHLTRSDTGAGDDGDVNAETARGLARLEVVTWTMVRECLSITFFTDDRQELHAMKLRSEDLEGRLATRLGAIRAMSEGVFDPRALA